MDGSEDGGKRWIDGEERAEEKTQGSRVAWRSMADESWF